MQVDKVGLDVEVIVMHLADLQARLATEYLVTARNVICQASGNLAYLGPVPGQIRSGHPCCLAVVAMWTSERWRVGRAAGLLRFACRYRRGLGGVDRPTVAERGVHRRTGRVELVGRH